jgi:hypothetical protein
MITIKIASDFSPTPGGRFRKMGPKSGEEFRDLLASHLAKNEPVVVVLDGVEGYGSSFLEEAFGGLARLRQWSQADIGRLLTIQAMAPEYKTYEREAKQYLSEAFGRANA